MQATAIAKSEEKKKTEKPRAQDPSLSGPIHDPSSSGLPFFLRQSAQAKLAVGAANDPLEREAEAVADRITRGASGPQLQHKSSGGGEDESAQPRISRTTVQRRADGPTAHEAPPSVSEVLATPGAPLDQSVRRSMEPGFGHNFEQVRVHNDAKAAESARDVNALAYTAGDHIVFGSGQYAPGTASGDHLLAHELTHTVQQTGGVQRQLVQRIAPGGTGSPPPTGGAAAPPPDGGALTGPSSLETPTGYIDLNHPKKMILPRLEIPEFKAQFLKSDAMVTIKKGGEKRPTSQRNIWKTAVGPTAEKTAEEKLKKTKGVRPTSAPGDGAKATDDASENANKLLFLQIGGGENYLIGTPVQIKSEFTIPRWGPDGKPRLLDVDHQLELQLGGTNDTGNMWLLDASANRSSGSIISSNIRDSIRAAVHPHVGKPPFKEAPDPDLLRQQYEITYKKVVGSAKLNPTDKDAKWEKGEVEQVEKPLAKLKALDYKEITSNSRKLVGTKTSLALYPLSTGGKKKNVEWKPDTTTEVDFNAVKHGFIGLSAAKIKYEVGKGGYVRGTFTPTRAKKEVKPRTVTLPLVEVGGIPYTVALEKSGVLQAMRFAELYKFSPIEFEEVSFEDGKGFVMRGKLTPTIPIFQKLDIALVMDGNDISLSKTFTADDFKFPGPVKVPEASMTLSIGTEGVKAHGVVLLQVDGLGKGRITAGIGSSGGLELAGNLDFDTKLFDLPANIHAGYKDGKLSGAGTLSIKPGKIRGIKSATIKASIDDGVIDAKGSITPDMPAVEQADLTMHYDPKTGLTIAGDLQLKKNIHGIASGSVHAEVTKKDDRYTVKASGEATPKIPGISSKFRVAYDDGAFDASITAAYEKGMLKGSVRLGATNRPVDENGKPGAPPAGKADTIIVYGGGSVSLKLAPWLQATAAIKFKPNGEVEVTGKIGLPSVINLFGEKKFSKNIFKLGFDIPILGFSVLGHRVGIFLNIGGGLDLSAGIGPGQLQEVELSVTYNPDREEDAQVHGHAGLHIPANAGLRLFVRAALGAGIPIVSAEAGIELGGTLGIEGALNAGVDVDWTPKKGLVIDANAEVYAEPKFKFDITGFVLVEADLLLKTITLYEKKWELAAVEYGSGLRLGLKLPVHYEEGKPFSVSLSDIQFEVPKVDAMSVIKGLFNKII